MTLTIDLNPEEMAALASQAAAQGVDVETVVHSLIAQVKPTVAIPEKNRAAIALLESVIAERDAASSEELDRRDVELEEFKANINRWRAEDCRPPAYR